MCSSDLLNDGRRVEGLIYPARRDHPQYAGRLTPSEAAALVRQGVGNNGTSRDYLANTVTHLDALGLSDHGLSRLLALVDGSFPHPPTA